MQKQIGYIGLGKMGGAMVSRLEKEQWSVVSYDKFVKGTAKDVPSLVEQLQKPRIVWIMVPAGKPVDEVLFGEEGLAQFLDEGDTVIDGGNSFFENSVKRAEKLSKKGIHFLDVGVSGGPQTVKDGKPAVMIGGGRAVFEKTRPVFESITEKNSFGYMGKSGSGHFVKMIHNGIEYGIMQSLAEGFAVMKESSFKVDLEEVARVYSRGSVIESRLTKWMLSGFQEYGQDLRAVVGSVKHTGEGEWTVKTAKKFKVPVPAIKASFDFRVQSSKKPSYIGKVLMMLRNQFGGHDIK